MHQFSFFAIVTCCCQLVMWWWNGLEESYPNRVKYKINRVCVLFLSWVVCKICDYHRTAEVERYLWRLSIFWPFWWKQDQLEQVSHVCFQYIHLQEWGYITSLSNLFKCSIILIVRKLFLMFWQSSLYFFMCPLPFVLSLDTAKKSLTLAEQLVVF